MTDQKYSTEELSFALQLREMAWKVRNNDLNAHLRNQDRDFDDATGREAAIAEWDLHHPISLYYDACYSEVAKMADLIREKVKAE